MKLDLRELKKALEHIEKNSGDLFPVLRVQVNHLEIAFTNIEGEAATILVYDTSTNLPAKLSTFSRLK